MLTVETEKLREEFAYFAKRPDLLSEMSGLSWSLGVVDLRSLVAFQRKTRLSTRGPLNLLLPIAGELCQLSLLALSFGPPKLVEYDVFHDQALTSRPSSRTIETIRIYTFASRRIPSRLLIVSMEVDPFFEVACFRDRWFLRDGYHRACGFYKRTRYLRFTTVIVEAATIKELGANRPWFFPEEVLFSDTPPRVIDFLSEDLVLEYDRPPLIKTVRIKLEETLKPRQLHRRTIMSIATKRGDG